MTELDTTTSPDDQAPADHGLDRRDADAADRAS